MNLQATCTNMLYAPSRTTVHASLRMLTTAAAVSLATAGAASTAPSPDRALPPGWRLSPPSKRDSEPPVQLTFAIKQDGMDALERALQAVSDPLSDSYGEHWTIDQIEAVTKTRPRARAVAAWARSIAERVETTTGGDFVRAWASHAQVERLLWLRLQRHRHQHTGVVRWALPSPAAAAAAAIPSISD